MTTDLAEILRPLLDSLREEIRREVRAELDERLAGMPGQLLTETEACARLRLCRHTLQQMRRDGVIPHIYLGSALRYRREDIDALVEKRMVKARPRRLSAAS